MENNHHGHHHHQHQQQHHQVESSADDFLDEILTAPSYASETDAMQFGQVSEGVDSIALQLGTGSNNHGRTGFLGMPLSSMGIAMPLGLNSFDSNASSTITSESNERDSVLMTNLFPAFGNLQTQSVHPTPSPQPTQLPQQQIRNQPAARTALNPPMNRPRVRARRGQATDPHSIAERLRRERISERMRALQELVPSCNKTDRAAMLDEIVDYVKFLRLQVKVLSTSRLGGAGAVAQLISEVPSSSIEVEESDEGKNNQAGWDKGSIDGIEEQVAKLMEEDIGAAMQLLQSKALCIMPVSLASAIFPNALLSLKPESDISS